MTKYVAPKDLFKGEFAELAPLFAANRFDQNGKILENTKYHNNAAAIEAYNPISGTRIQKNGLSEPLSAKTQRGYQNTNYGHSEPRIMIDLLNDIIPNNFKEGDFLKPADWNTIRSPYPPHVLPQEQRLKRLVEDTDYQKNAKTFMEKEGYKLNTISEYPFCSTNGGCKAFMDNISPNGSEAAYIHTGSGTNNRDTRARELESTIVKQFQPAYQDYLRNQQQGPQQAPQSRFSAFDPFSRRTPNPTYQPQAYPQGQQGYKPPYQAPGIGPQLGAAQQQYALQAALGQQPIYNLPRSSNPLSTPIRTNNPNNIGNIAQRYTPTNYSSSSYSSSPFNTPSSSLSFSGSPPPFLPFGDLFLDRDPLYNSQGDESMSSRSRSNSSSSLGSSSSSSYF